MTGTEERLRDALSASVSRVRDDRLRPFPDLDPSWSGAGPEPTRRPPAWRVWMIPVAAAASVVLAIGLVMAVTGGPAHHAAVGPATTSPTASFPEYFADLENSHSTPEVQVRSSSTGAVVASAPSPAVRGWLVNFDGIAAAPDARTFYVDYDASHVVKSSIVEQIWVYRLTIPSGAAAARLVRIKGGVISGDAGLGTGGPMAVSPGGTELALTADTSEQLDANTGGYADKIIVINLLTGTRSVWQGGLYRSDKTFSIANISWTTDGRSLVFLGQWCNFPSATNLCSGTSGSQGYRDTQVRSLSVATGGGALSQGPVLLTQSARYPVIAAAVAGPGPAELSVIVLSGHQGSFGAWAKIAIDRVAEGSGSLLGVDYRANASGGEGQTRGVELSADPSGRYLLLSYSGPGGLYTGWIGPGKLHFLPIKQPYLGWFISAW